MNRSTPYLFVIATLGLIGLGVMTVALAARVSFSFSEDAQTAAEAIGASILGGLLVVLGGIPLVRVARSMQQRVTRAPRGGSEVRALMVSEVSGKETARTSKNSATPARVAGDAPAAPNRAHRSPYALLATPANRRLVFASLCLIFASWGALLYVLIKPRVEVHTMNLSSGTPGGSYFGAGNVISTTVNKNLHRRIHLNNVGSSGSAENVRKIEEGAASFALTQDGLYATDRVRSLLQLYRSPLLIFARKDRGIKEFRDLAGRHVYVGATESGTKKVFELVSGQYGISVIPGAESATFDGAAEELIAGNVDAACFLTTISAPAVQRIARSGVAMMVPIERSDSVVFSYPYLDVLTVPRGAIAGANECPSEKVQTVASREILVCASDVSEAIVFDILAAIYEGLPDLVQQFPLATQISRIDPQHAFYYRLHPGASKYYQDERLTWHGFLEITYFLIMIFGHILAIKAIIVRLREGAIMKPLEALAKEIQEGQTSLRSDSELATITFGILRARERAVEQFLKHKLSKESFERIELYAQSLKAKLGAVVRIPTGPAAPAPAAAETQDGPAPTVASDNV